MDNGRLNMASVVRSPTQERLYELIYGVTAQGPGRSRVLASAKAECDLRIQTKLSASTCCWLRAGSSPSLLGAVECDAQPVILAVLHSRLSLWSQHYHNVSIANYATESGCSWRPVVQGLAQAQALTLAEITRSTTAANKACCLYQLSFGALQHGWRLSWSMY